MNEVYKPPSQISGTPLVDRITRFSGSMKFIYLHVIWFGSWVGFRVEHYPFGMLTMVVSLEAIFLSTFVMISQNRADEKRQALADQQWQTVQDEGRQNERLLQLSDEILELTKAVHTTTTAGRSTGNGQSPTAEALQPDPVPVGVGPPVGREIAPRSHGRA
jgi:uncharacterized membrane protein